MNVLVTPTYDNSLIVLSYAAAVVGSFLALTAARRIVGTDDRVSYYNALVAGIALGGVGVWSMHFIGMLAAQLHMGVAYSSIETAISLIAAIAAASIALAYVAAAPKQLSRILIAGIMLGLGVVVMHYLGIHGMRFGGLIDWSWPTVGLSVFIAIIAATAALWLAFNTRTWSARLVSALVMGVAVCAMHYTGMAAAQFVCTTATPQSIPSGFGFFSALELPVWVSLLTLFAAFMLAVELFIRSLADTPVEARA